MIDSEARSHSAEICSIREPNYGYSNPRRRAGTHLSLRKDVDVLGVCKLVVVVQPELANNMWHYVDTCPDSRVTRFHLLTRN